MISFRKRIVIQIFDLQIFMFSIFIINIIGMISLGEFFYVYGAIFFLIWYLFYFPYLDFIKKQSPMMHYYNYRLIYPDKVNYKTMIKYELLRVLDVPLFIIYLIQDNFSDKKGRLLLSERYTGIRVEEISLNILKKG